MEPFGSDQIVLVAAGICLLAITISTIVLTKIIRNRQIARRRKLRKRNSLQKYPTFIANKITGVITIFPSDRPRGSFDSQFSKYSQHYIICVAPQIDYYNSHLSLYERLYAYPGRAQRARSVSESSVPSSASSYTSDTEDNNNQLNQHIISGLTDENNNEIFPYQNHDRNSDKK